MLSTSAFAQKTVAVYVTSNDGVSQKIKKVVGSEFVETITHTDEYIAVERTEDFLTQVSHEKGNYEINDATLYQLGRKFGASNVCVVDIIKFDDGYYIVARLLDIKTSKVWKTARRKSKLKSLDEVIVISQDLANGLFKKKEEYSYYIPGDNVDDHSFLLGIENCDNYTKVVLQFLSTNPNQKIGINEASYIEDMCTHKRYKLIDASNINIISHSNDSQKHIGKGIWEYYLFFERIPDETNNIVIVEPNGRKYSDIVLKPFGKDNWFIFDIVKSDMYVTLYETIKYTNYIDSDNTSNKPTNKEQRRLMKDTEKTIYDYDNYYSVAVGNGIGYGGGNTCGIALTKRIGNIIGIEPHISVGISSKDFKTSITPALTYSVGINLFVYKGMYIGSTFGINDYETHYKEYTSDNGEVLFSQHEGEIVTYKGLSFIAGWKCYINAYSFGGWYLDFAAGCRTHSKDTKTLVGFDVISPIWSLGIGFIID